MAEQIRVNPAEVVDNADGLYAGYAAIARHLSALNPERPRPVSRQLVHRWYQRSGYNNLPAPCRVRVRSGKVKLMFDVTAVEQWYRLYRMTRKTSDEIETIPLFQMDDEGKPVC